MWQEGKRHMVNIICTDFNFRHERSVVIVIAASDAAKAFVRDHICVEPWQRYGGGFAVDTRIANDLAPKLEDDGFSVSHS
jgi:hypothetical protein